MARADLAAIFNLAPSDAIKYLSQKGYQISFNWKEVWKEAHARSFTVAGVLKMDVLSDIKTALEKALEEGNTLQSFINDLMPTLERKGWVGKGYMIDHDTGEIEGKLLNPTRLETIFRTNTQTAYMAGRYNQMMENVEYRPYWEYSAVMDGRVRPSHAALNGRIFMFNDPFWESFFPPNGFNCRCSVRARSAADIKRLNLAISNSEGQLKEGEQLINEKESRPAMQYDDPVHGKSFIADPGFDYNPGKVAFEPDLSNYPPELVAQYQKSLSHDN